MPSTIVSQILGEGIEGRSSFVSRILNRDQSAEFALLKRKQLTPETSLYGQTIGAFQYGVADIAEPLMNFLGAEDASRFFLQFKNDHPEYAPEEVENWTDLITNPRALLGRISSMAPYVLAIAGTAAIPYAGPYAAAGMVFGIEYQRAHDQALSLGKDESDAKLYGTTAGIVNTALNLLQVKILGSFVKSANLTRYANYSKAWRALGDGATTEAMALIAKTGAKGQTAKFIATQAGIAAFQSVANELIANKTLGEPIPPGMLDRTIQAMIGGAAAETVFGLGGRYIRGLTKKGDSFPADLTVPQREYVRNLALEQFGMGPEYANNVVRFADQIVGGLSEFNKISFGDQWKRMLVERDPGVEKVPTPVELAPEPAGEKTPVSKPKSAVPDWVQESMNQSFAEAQKVGVVKDIVDLSAEGLVAKQVAERLSSRLPKKNEAEIIELIRGVRAHENIPSSDDPEFKIWQEQYKKGLLQGGLREVPPDTFLKSPGDSIRAIQFKDGSITAMKSKEHLSVLKASQRQSSEIERVGVLVKRPDGSLAFEGSRAGRQDFDLGWKAEEKDFIVDRLGIEPEAAKVMGAEKPTVEIKEGEPGALFQPQKVDLSSYVPSRRGSRLGVYEYQDVNAEKIIHERWEVGNGMRYRLENAGDVLRELGKKYPAQSYLNEKIEGVDRFLNKESPDELIKLVKPEGDKLNRLVEAYEKQPTDTPQQELVRQTIVAMGKGEFEKARGMLELVKQSLSETENLHQGNKISILSSGKLNPDSFDSWHGQPGKAVTIMLKDGRALIRAVQNPDSSSLLHELFHVFRKHMPEEWQAKLLKWTGEKSWEVKAGEQPVAEEKSARAWEAYLRDGETPAPFFRRIFDYFKTQMQRVYKTSQELGMDQQMSPEVKEIFRSLIGEEVKSPIEKYMMDTYISPRVPSIMELRGPDTIDTPSLEYLNTEIAKPLDGVRNMWRSIRGFFSLQSGVNNTVEGVQITERLTDAETVVRMAHGAFINAEGYPLLLEAQKNGSLKELERTQTVSVGQLKAEFANYRRIMDRTGVIDPMPFGEGEGHPLIQLLKKINRYIGSEYASIQGMTRIKGVLQPFKNPQETRVMRIHTPEFWQLVTRGYGRDYAELVQLLKALNPKEFRDFKDVDVYLAERFRTDAKRKVGWLEEARRIKVFPDAFVTSDGRRIQLLSTNFQHIMEQSLQLGLRAVALQRQFGQTGLDDVTTLRAHSLLRALGKDLKPSDENLRNQLIERGVTIEELQTRKPIFQGFFKNKKFEEYVQRGLDPQFMARMNVATSIELKTALDSLTQKGAVVPGGGQDAVLYMFLNDLIGVRNKNPWVSRKTLSTQAKLHEISTKITKDRVISELDQLTPNFADERTDKILRAYARKIQGVDLNLKGADLFADIKERIKGKVIETTLDKLIEAHRARGGDPDKLIAMIKFWQGLPIYQLKAGPLWTATKFISNVIGALQTSTAVLPNLPQTAAQVPGSAGLLNYSRAVSSFWKDPVMSRSQMYALLGLPQSIFLYIKTSGGFWSNLGYTIRSGVARATGLRMVDEMNNIISAEAHRRLAMDWKGGGFSKKDISTARNLRLNQGEISGLLKGEMSDLTFRKIIQSGVAITQYTSEFPHYRSKLEANPLWRIIFAYNNYVMGQSRMIGRMLNEGLEAFRAVKRGDVGPIQTFTKRFSLALAGSVGAGALSLMLRNAVRGKLEDMDETTFDKAGGAMMEVAFFGAAQRAIDPFRYDGGVISNAWVGFIPQLSFIQKFLGSLLKYGRYGKMDFTERMSRTTKRNIPILRGLSSWADSIAYPDLASFQRARDAASKFSRSVLGESGGMTHGEDAVTPEFLRIHEALAQGDEDYAQELAMRYYQKAVPEMANSGKDPREAVLRLRASLLNRRPINLDFESLLKFLATQPRNRQVEFMRTQSRYTQMVNYLAPVGG